MHNILVGVLQEREGQLGELQGQGALLVQRDLQGCCEGGLDRRAVKLCNIPKASQPGRHL